MFKLYFRAVGWLSFQIGRLIMSSERLQDLARRLVLWWLGLTGAAVAIWVFWDLLPLLAIGFMAWHFYQWRYRERW